MNTESRIARLRESKEKHVDRMRAQGHKYGKEWALEVAEYDQLERVAKLAEGLGGEWPASGAMYSLAEAIDESQRDYQMAEDLFRTDAPSDDQVEGFIEGAAEVFAEV